DFYRIHLPLANLEVVGGVSADKCFVTGLKSTACIPQVPYNRHVRGIAARPLNFLPCLCQIEPVESLCRNKQIDRAVGQPARFGGPVNEYAVTTTMQPPVRHTAHIRVGLNHVDPVTPLGNLLRKNPGTCRNVRNDQTRHNRDGVVQKLEECPRIAGPELVVVYCTM